MVCSFYGAAHWKVSPLRACVAAVATQFPVSRQTGSYDSWVLRLRRFGVGAYESQQQPYTDTYCGGRSFRSKIIRKVAQQLVPTETGHLR